MAQLVSINVGLPRDIEWKGQKVHTAIWKQPVQGRVAARHLNLEGDGQGDLAGHGGEHRAVMMYQMDAYRYWEAYLRRNDFSMGQFGENFTVDGLADDEVCIGDRYRIGSAGALSDLGVPFMSNFPIISIITFLPLFGAISTLVRNPKTLLYAAGLRREPIMSLPSATGIIRIASALAAPPLLPPEVIAGLYALPVAPKIML